MSLGDVPNTASSSLTEDNSGVILLASLSVRAEDMAPYLGWSDGKKGSPGLDGVMGIS